MNRETSVPARATDMIAFWCEAGPDKWFAKEPEFDRRFRERFLELHLLVAARHCDRWITSAEGALALILLTDQYPRNAFRGTAHMYATDPLARLYAREAEAAQHWSAVASELRTFFWLPFEHSEALADQDFSVLLAGRMGEPYLEYAVVHRDVIRRFGRFPHRNPMLARATTAEEARFLAEGGFVG
ncbi:MAG: DUF924 family protein [Acetobacteraceae bacterium]